MDASNIRRSYLILMCHYLDSITVTITLKINDGNLIHLVPVLIMCVNSIDVLYYRTNNIRTFTPILHMWQTSAILVFLYSSSEWVLSSS